jgi:WD40 repeat protein
MPPRYLSSSSSSSVHITQHNECVAHDGPTRTLAIGGLSGLVLASGGDDGCVNVWRLGRPAHVLSFRDLKRPVTSVSFSPSERLLAVGTEGGAVRVFNLSSSSSTSNGSVGGSRAPKCAIASAHRSSVTCLEWHSVPGLMPAETSDSTHTVQTGQNSPVDRFLASGGSDGRISLIDVEKNSILITLSYSSSRPSAAGFASGAGSSSSSDIGEIQCLRFAPHGRWLAAGDSLGRILIFDLASGRLLFCWGDEDLTSGAALGGGHRGAVTSLAFHMEELLLVSGGSDRTIRFYSLDTSGAHRPGQIALSPADSGPIRAIRFITCSSSQNTLGGTSLSNNLMGSALVSITDSHLRVWSVPGVWREDIWDQTYTLDIVSVNGWASPITESWIGYNMSIKSKDEASSSVSSAQHLQLVVVSADGAFMRAYGVDLTHVSPLNGFNTPLTATSSTNSNFNNVPSKTISNTNSHKASSSSSSSSSVSNTNLQNNTASGRQEGRDNVLSQPQIQTKKVITSSSFQTPIQNNDADKQRYQSVTSKHSGKSPAVARISLDDYDDDKDDDDEEEEDKVIVTNDDVNYETKKDDNNDFIVEDVDEEEEVIKEESKSNDVNPSSKAISQQPLSRQLMSDDAKKSLANALQTVEGVRQRMANLNLNKNKLPIKANGVSIPSEASQIPISSSLSRRIERDNEERDTNTMDESLAGVSEFVMRPDTASSHEKNLVIVASSPEKAVDISIGIEEIMAGMMTSSSPSSNSTFPSHESVIMTRNVSSSPTITIPIQPIKPVLVSTSSTSTSNVKSPLIPPLSPRIGNGSLASVLPSLEESFYVNSSSSNNSSRQHISRSVGDFVPATRDRPFGVVFEAFLPDNAAQGFGASRIQPLAASPAFFRSQTGSNTDDRIINSITQGREAFLVGMKKRARAVERSSRAWRDLDAKAAMASLVHNSTSVHGLPNSPDKNQHISSPVKTLDGAEASAAADVLAAVTGIDITARYPPTFQSSSQNQNSNSSKKNNTDGPFKDLAVVIDAVLVSKKIPGGFTFESLNLNLEAGVCILSAAARTLTAINTSSVVSSSFSGFILASTPFAQAAVIYAANTVFLAFATIVRTSLVTNFGNGHFRLGIYAGAPLFVDKSSIDQLGLDPGAEDRLNRCAAAIEKIEMIRSAVERLLLSWRKTFAITSSNSHASTGQKEGAASIVAAAQTFLTTYENWRKTL